MKLKIIIFALGAALMLLIAGCSGAKSPVPASGAEKTFASMKEAYDSGLSLKCTATASTVTVTVYFSDKNIRMESGGPAQTTYQVITSDDRYYMWQSDTPEKVISLSGEGVAKTRLSILNAPLTVPCTEETLDPSLFEPPK